MKNPQTPRPITERTFEFAVRIVGPLIQEADELQRILGSIIISSKGGS